MSTVFSCFLQIEFPRQLTCGPDGRNPAFAVELVADGPIPFPQLVLRQHGREHLAKDERIRHLGSAADGSHSGRADVPGGRVDAPREARVHRFVYDQSGIKHSLLHLRTDQGERTLSMSDLGPYPCETRAPETAHYCTADLPPGLGDVRYFLEAEDGCGNVARGILERVFLA